MSDVSAQARYEQLASIEQKYLTEQTRLYTALDIKYKSLLAAQSAAKSSSNGQPVDNKSYKGLFDDYQSQLKAYNAFQEMILKHQKEVLEAKDVAKKEKKAQQKEALLGNGTSSTTNGNAASGDTNNNTIDLTGVPSISYAGPSNTYSGVMKNEVTNSSVDSNTQKALPVFAGVDVVGGTSKATSSTSTSSSSSNGGGNNHPGSTGHSFGVNAGVVHSSSVQAIPSNYNARLAQPHSSYINHTGMYSRYLLGMNSKYTQDYLQLDTFPGKNAIEDDGNNNQNGSKGSTSKTKTKTNDEEEEEEDIPSNGSEYVPFHSIRSSLFSKLMLLGRQRNVGMKVWTAYWNGLRSFMLFRCSHVEFMSVLLDDLQLDTDILALHNQLICTLLNNVRSGAGLEKEVKELLPYIVTDDEIAAYHNRQQIISSNEEMPEMVNGSNAKDDGLAPINTATGSNNSTGMDGMQICSFLEELHPGILAQIRPIHSYAVYLKEREAERIEYKRQQNAAKTAAKTTAVSSSTGSEGSSGAPGLGEARGRGRPRGSRGRTNRGRGTGRGVVTAPKPKAPPVVVSAPEPSKRGRGGSSVSNRGGRGGRGSRGGSVMGRGSVSTGRGSSAPIQSQVLNTTESAAALTPLEPGKSRGRGRPPLPSTIEKRQRLAAAQAEQSSNGVSVADGRDGSTAGAVRGRGKRGRPPLNKKRLEINSSTSAPSPGRGRPPKIAKVANKVQKVAKIEPSRSSSRRSPRL